MGIVAGTRNLIGAGFAAIHTRGAVFCHAVCRRGLHRAIDVIAVDCALVVCACPLFDLAVSADQCIGVTVDACILVNRFITAIAGIAAGFDA